MLILQPFRRFTYVTSHSPTLPLLYLRHSSFSNPSVASSTSQLILQTFFRFSYITSSSLTSPGKPPMRSPRSALSPTFPSLHLSQLILQPFRRFIYVSSFYNPSVASPTSQLILQPFFRFSYVTSSSLTSPGETPMRSPRSAHSLTFPSLHLRHSPFSNPSVALPTSHIILQPFRCFTYITAHSPNLLSVLLHHKLFTYVTW